MTNGDKMRQHDDLALAAVITCVNCPPHDGCNKSDKKMEPCETCVMCWYRWLQGEAKL